MPKPTVTFPTADHHCSVADWYQMILLDDSSARSLPNTGMARSRTQNIKSRKSNAFSHYIIRPLHNNNDNKQRQAGSTVAVRCHRHCDAMLQASVKEVGGTEDARDSWTKYDACPYQQRLESCHISNSV